MASTILIPNPQGAATAAIVAFKGTGFRRDIQATAESMGVEFTLFHGTAHAQKKPISTAAEVVEQRWR